MNAGFQSAVEAFLVDLSRIHASGGSTPERSIYGPLYNLLNAVGATLSPRVYCVQEIADQGAGHPDLGIYTANQVQRGKPQPGQIPERGVVEIKAIGDDAWITAASHQVSRYWERYRLVLVTNAREFVLLGEDEEHRAVTLETFRIANNADSFRRKLENPHKLAREIGGRLGEYLSRALAHQASLAEPKDLAWLLASYARDGLGRAEAAGDIQSLRAVRTALEEALGIRFEGDRGARFFHSTFVQTLFYGVFAAWVLWARETEDSDLPLFKGDVAPARFEWRTSVWHLRAPVLRALFQQLSDPGRLKPLGLVEVLDWSAAALNRVDRRAFFQRFNEGEAVPYFYEPFLEAFDPELRRQLGVWYTPREVVQYMVARIDMALKSELGVQDGLAAENVYVLDPCCGTGAFVSEVLRRIAGNINGSGLGALDSSRLRRATKRVLGFELMPAPFVVSHLQVGVTMRELGAPLSDEGEERAQIFLTNALTGWEPSRNKPVLFHELEEERDRADRIKQQVPILVVLGNPPYNGFAGMAMDEERELSDAYRATRLVRPSEGQGLNDLYVRFFRMAERRITERTGRGIVSFISNYSWLEGLSFTGMRERFLDSFDSISIDCLNGDKFKTGKTTPDGLPDPSIFSTENDPVGIQVGTSIATLVRNLDHTASETIRFRHLWGSNKRDKLIATSEANSDEIYTQLRPVLRLGLPFVPTTVSNDWFEWPSLTDLIPISFPGVKTSRDRFLVDHSLDRLKERVSAYFDSALSFEELVRRYPSVARSVIQGDPRDIREALVRRGGPNQGGFVRFAYRPFDTRWLYWERDTRLLDRERADYKKHILGKNMWISAAQSLRKNASSPQACFTQQLGSLHLIERGTAMFPAWLLDDGLECNGEPTLRENITATAQQYLERMGRSVEDLFYHILAILHHPSYLESNSGGLSSEWPRIPLPLWSKGKAGRSAIDILDRSSAIGRRLSALLDTEVDVERITHGVVRQDLRGIAVPTTVDGGRMEGDDFAVKARWGRLGNGEGVMPGKGHIVERKFTAEEQSNLADCLPTLGDTTIDVYMNDGVYWRNVPARVWNYRLGGYQVLKKWLSYRDQRVLGRVLHHNEVANFCRVSRRVSEIIRVTNDRGYTALVDEMTSVK